MSSISLKATQDVAEVFTSRHSETNGRHSRSRGSGCDVGGLASEGVCVGGDVYVLECKSTRTEDRADFSCISCIT